MHCIFTCALYKFGGHATWYMYPGKIQTYRLKIVTIPAFTMHLVLLNLVTSYCQVWILLHVNTRQYWSCTHALFNAFWGPINPHTIVCLVILHVSVFNMLLLWHVHYNTMCTYVQALCLAIGRGILYSAGSDLSLRSWHIDSLEEIGVVKVQPVLLRKPPPVQV